MHWSWTTSTEFINLKSVKLSRALSCDSVSSDISDSDDFYGNNENESKEIRDPIPDIATWMKNPTDFFRLPNTNSNRRASEDISFFAGSEEIPWQPSESSTSSRRASCYADSNSLLLMLQPQILVSLSYLPTAERLSVIIVKVRIPIHYDPTVKFVFVKAFLSDDKNGKKFNKKKTRWVDSNLSRFPCVWLYLHGFSVRSVLFMYSVHGIIWSNVLLKHSPHNWFLDWIHFLWHNRGEADKVVLRLLMKIYFLRNNSFQPTPILFRLYNNSLKPLELPSNDPNSKGRGFIPVTFNELMIFKVRIGD